MNEAAEIPQAAPGRTAAFYRKEIEEALKRVLASGNYILGEEVRRFEEEFAANTGVSFCFGVANGTDAIHLSLLSAGVKHEDLLIAPSFVPSAVATGLLLAGTIPVLVDVRPETMTLDPGLVEDTIIHIRKNTSHYSDRRIAGILLVHLFGHPCHIDDFRTLASKYDLAIFEDCAQAHNTGWKGSMCGSFGKTAAFSFYPTKNLGALGDAGCIVTNDPDCARNISLLRQYGWRERNISDTFGYNSRLDDIQAAVLRVKLPHLDAENRMRMDIARFYDEALGNLPLTLPATLPGAQHTFHQYVIRSEKRDALKLHLGQLKARTAVHYPSPIHTQGAFADRICFGQGGFDCTQRICSSVLSLPMFPRLEKNEAERVAAGIKDFFEK